MASLSLRKTSLLAASVALVLLIGLHSHRSRLGAESILGSNLETPTSELANKKALTALLGEKELPAALWFPFVGTGFRPEVAQYNKHPPEQPRPRTPLFIGFTRNHQLLEQTVLSYISAGWPREDIIVVDNSGTFDANSQGLLSKHNPFYLDYNLYRSTYGVSILQTPTLLTFSQLMNFFLRTAVAQRWPIYFWSHQDVAALGDETANPYKSFYQRVLEVLGELNIRSQQDFLAQRKAKKGDWAVKFFAYDWLTLVNVEAWRTIGPWDTFIPYYTTDCDAYSRVALHGFTKEDAKAGHMYDVSEALSDLKHKFFPTNSSERPNSKRFDELKHQLDDLMDKKWKQKGASRNGWQEKQKGGRGEPWTYDPIGFESMWWDTAVHGRTLYEKKWGTSECRLEDKGISISDQFPSR